MLGLGASTSLSCAMQTGPLFFSLSPLTSDGDTKDKTLLALSPAMHELDYRLSVVSLSLDLFLSLSVAEKGGPQAGP